MHQHTEPTPQRHAGRAIVVAGNGMVGERFLLEADRAGLLDRDRLVVIGEEPRAAYDRVHLSSYVEGVSAEALSVADGRLHTHPSVEVRLGRRVAAIDRAARTVALDDGTGVGYDELVLATGSRPFVPPIPGADLPGCHVYRTVEDLDAITISAATSARGVVIGGGLLGLEAANALQLLGVEVTVVEFADRLMPRQLDEPSAEVLADHVRALGIEVRLATATRQILPGPDGRVARLIFADGTQLDTGLVVFSAGIRARDELAGPAELDTGPRGGFAVGPTLRTADPSIHAIGECASVDGTIYGLVGPGYSMARVLARRLAGGQDTFEGAEESTRLKLLGVEVASFGDAMASTAGARRVVVHDPSAGLRRTLVAAGDGATVLGGILVGDASGYDQLLRMTLSGRPADRPLSALAAPVVDAPAVTAGELADGDLVCTCNTVTKAQVCAAIDDGCTTVKALSAATDVATGCGSCAALCGRILNSALTERGMTVDTALCAHFRHTRQELFEIVAVRGHATFAEVLADVGTGGGCEICKPTVASILATQRNEYVLSPDHAPLQDTNDRFLANLQRDGTYSVVPRIPGGEITPDKLLVLGLLARDFDLYTKITGGQRIDLFGARLEQLPAIWRRLVDAGFESGHAYGKALRTVKSCVGRTWCRYGVQDSTSLAIRLEQRYRGLRSPHKIKMAVSGCSRECAEAQGKDVGVIATEAGWNLYVCGNGGMKPQHAALLATDQSTSSLVRTIDRFLAYYVRTADKLERTATWLNRLEGGIDHVRAVVLEDSLGLAEELEAVIAQHVATYACEWAETLDDPDRLAMFASYVNDTTPDPDLAYIRERGQRRPATPEERHRLLPVVDLAAAGEPAAARALPEGALR